MNELIIVMGGSFNPPTIAHQRLLLDDVNALGADKGIFVPSSHTYVSIKMRRAGFPEEVLPEATRLEMLSAMAEEDPRLEVTDVEFLKNYRYAVVDRGDGDLDAILREIPAAWERRDRFRYITPPEGILNISSTMICEKMRNNEPGVEGLLHAKVLEMLRMDGMTEVHL